MTELEKRLHDMCKQLAGGYVATKDLVEELQQEAYVACLEAMSNYDPSKYDNPEQFFWFKALNATSKYYKTHDKVIKPPERISRAAKAEYLMGGSQSQVDALTEALTQSYDETHESYFGEENNTFEEHDYRANLAHRIVSDLTEEELRVIYLRYFYDDAKVMTYREVSELLEVEGLLLGKNAVKAREVSALEVLRHPNS